MIRVSVKYPSVGCFRGVVLKSRCQLSSNEEPIRLHTSFCCSWTWPIWNHMSSSVNGLGGFVTMYLKHCDDISNDNSRREDCLIPPGFDCTFAAVYRLSRDGNISHLPFQSRAAYASLGKRPPRHVREIRSDRTGYQYHTRVSAPTINRLANAGE